VNSGLLTLFEIAMKTKTFNPKDWATTNQMIKHLKIIFRKKNQKKKPFLFLNVQ